jgi:C4-dicarboxylate transporter DctM subunit
MESAAQVILLVPLFMPVVTALGIDPIVFGLIVVANCEIGFLTPPVGANLFVGMRLANTTLEQISIAVLPFLLPYLGIIVLLALYPQVALFLPKLAFGN